MRVAALFSDVASIKQFQPSALYLLAQNCVDDSVRNAAISEAEAGQLITRMTVEKLLSCDDSESIQNGRHQTQNVRNYVLRIARAREVESDFVDELAEMLIQWRLKLARERWVFALVLWLQLVGCGENSAVVPDVPTTDQLAEAVRVDENQRGFLPRTYVDEDGIPGIGPRLLERGLSDDRLVRLAA
jgi:hypothetical protein